MGSAATWQLGSHEAYVRCAELTAKLDLTQVGRGLHHICWADQTLVAGELFGVSLVERTAPGRREPPASWSLTDCYARGADLVMTFAAEGSSPVRWQVYWSASLATLAGARCAVFDVRVSVQTSVLDTHLECLLSSQLPGRQGRRLADVRAAADATCFLFRPSELSHQLDTQSAASASAPLSPVEPARTYIEMVHPADVRKTELLADRFDVPRLRHHLFDTDLEKGVIMRGRARGLVAPAEQDTDVAAAAWQAFVSEPPPLTT
jgi:hypothetical protein